MNGEIITRNPWESIFKPATVFDSIFDNIDGFYPKSRYIFEESKTGEGVLSIDALGIPPSDIDIELKGKVLSVISKESEETSKLVKGINMKFTIPEKFSSDISAKHINGLLEIKLGISEESKPKKIEVKS